MVKIIEKIRSNNFGFAEISSKLINWVCLPTVALIITPSLFGQIVLLYSYITIISILGAFGQQRAILMYAIKDSSTFYHTSIISIATALIISILVILLFDLSLLLLPIVLINIMVNNCVSLFRSMDNFKAFAFYRLAAAGGRFSFVIIFILVNPTLESYLFAELSSIALVFVIGILKKSVQVKNFCFKFDFKKITNLFGFGLPLFLQAGITQITQTGDRFIISSNLGSIALAKYFFVLVFCSSVAFIFAFNAQKYEVKIYRAISLDEARLNTFLFCLQSLKHGFFFYFISLFSYYVLTKASVEYSFDLIFMTSLYIYFYSNIFFTGLTYFFCYIGKSTLLILLTVLNGTAFMALIFIFIERIELYAISIAGIAVNSFTLLIFLFYIVRPSIAYRKKLDNKL